MRNWRNKFNVSHSITTNLRPCNLNSTLIADDAFISYSFVFATIAFPVLCWPKYSLAEKVQISYQILGYEYLHGHFDKLYGACVNALLPIFEKNRSNIGNIKLRVFEIGDDDYNGQDQELLNLSSYLNIT